MSPPSAFGTYRVLHQIGSGVLGPVFRAFDSEHDRLVAIKTFKLDLVPEDASRFVEQLRVLAAKLPAHPAIVGAVEAGLKGSVPYIALEYASGESLDVVMRQSGPTPLAKALPLLREIARAIDASWAVPVGHGALHPRDIFVTAGTTDVRITGFGIGQALEATGAKAPVRRPYSAPERATGSAWDARADVYSFGAIASEMLFGQQPASDDEAGKPVRRALATATSENPGDRFESAKAFLDALVEAADGSAQVDEAPAPVDESAVAPVPAAVVPDNLKRPARTKRPRPVAPELPLLAETPDTPATVTRVEPVVASVVPVAPVLSAQRPIEPVLAVRHRPATPVRPMGPAGPDGPDGPAGPFPWPAVAAVLLAGLVVGGVGGYQFGWSRGSEAGRPVATATPVVTTPAIGAEPPPGTTVAVPAPATPTVESRDAVPESASMGRLVIQSVPSGALVTIDGRRVGETPVTVPVPLGRHEVQVARPGYVPKTERVDLTARSTSRTMRMQLRRGAGESVAASATGAVFVESRPAGARVTIDGRAIGATTPVRIPELAAGSHRVQIDLAGYKPVTSTVNIVGGEVTRLGVTLERGELVMTVARRVGR